MKRLFIKRSQTVKAHKGEISFPGGVHEPEDRSLRQTSLRETKEEIGVRESDITIFGGLDDINTSTGFLVSPFIGRIPYPYPFQLSTDEVDDLVTVAIDDFYNPHHKVDFYYFNGRRVSSQLAFRIGEQTIWGATAKIMWRLLELGRQNDLFRMSPEAYHLAS